LKKIFIFIFFISIILSGCVEERSIIINNYSTQVITGMLRTQSTIKNYSLNPGEQYHYMLLVTMTHSMLGFQSSPDPDSVYMEMANDDTYEFFDNPLPPLTDPVSASIYNSLQKTVILYGNGAISTDPLTIGAGQEITTETIIKNNPVFTAETIDGFPVQVDYKFDEIEYLIILR